MKKRYIILAALLSLVALGSGIAIKLISDNNSKEVEKLKLEETDEACDNLFGGNTEIFEAGNVSLDLGNEDEDIIKPAMYRQHYYADGKLSIRFIAAVTSLNIDAIWTKALYNSDGSVNNAFKKSTFKSTKAYTAVQYYDSNNVLHQLKAEDVTVEGGTDKPYKYFVMYTIKEIPSTYSDCYFDARVELSNNTNKVVSKTCSVGVTSEATATSINVDELSVNNTEQIKSNSAGNAVYFNKTPKTLYNIGDSFNKSNFIAKVGNNVYTDFSVSGFDSSTKGKKTVTLDFGRASTTFDVYVLDEDIEPYTDAYGDYVVTVDDDYTGEIGAINGTAGNMFKTVSQALEFLQNNDNAYSANKILNIAPGYYYEKLEITTPNLTIVGAFGAAKGTDPDDENYDVTEFDESTIIEFDTLYGIKDLNDFTHTTDSTQTVAIRDTATNCKMCNVVISNSWNCEDYFYDHLDYLVENGLTKDNKPNEHRALALLVQADQFYMTESSLLGYQDTLELMKGRQCFDNCYISGTTDYIFGTNNITYFDHCTIHTIYNGSSTSGGYITAFKGSNKSDVNDSPEYGAVFSHCILEGDNDTTKVALGRPWSNSAKVAFIDCSMSECISTTDYSDIYNQTQGARYVAFSYNNGTSFYKPTDDDVEFIEYGNSGAGAINENETHVGMTVMSKSLYEDKFDNYEKIYVTMFGRTNGDITYPLAWTPGGGLETDNNTYYVFHGQAPTTGTSIEFDPSDCNVTGNYTVGDLTFTNCQRRTAGNDDLYVGGSISFHVDAGTSVTVNSYPGYHAYKIGDKYANSDTVTFYFDSAQDVVIEKSSSSAFYLYSIVINSTNQSDTSECSGVGLSFTEKEIYEGDSLDLSKLKVYAEYSTGYIIYLDSSEYTRTGSVDTTTPGNYSYTYIYDDKSKNLNVTVLENVVESITVTGYKTTYGVGSVFDDTMTVKATYSNESVVTLTSSDYEIDYSEVDFDTAGSYDVTVTYKANPSISTTFSVTVSAGEYTVTFMDGETVKSSCTGAAGNSITYPSDTKKAGYQFVRYYLDSDFTEVFDETVIPSQNVTVYMRYMQLNQSGVTYVSNATELVTAISNQSTIWLTADIDMTGSSYTGFGSAWAGNINGYGYTIENWTPTYTSNQCGFFGNAYQGTIEDIIFKDCVVSDGGTALQYLGLLTAGTYDDEIIRNVKLINCSMSTSSSSTVGLIGTVPQAHGSNPSLAIINLTIDGCSVAGTQYIGGIFGYVQNSTVISISNSNIGVILSGCSQEAGGFAGLMQGSSSVSISNSVFEVTCNQNGTKIIGCIVGEIKGTTSITIINSEISLNVTNGDTYIGGIVGYGNAGTVTVSNTNIELDIKAAYSIGGAIGQINAATLTISNAHVEGSIIATNGASNYENTFVGHGDNGTNFSTCTYSNFTLTGASATLQGTEVII